MQIDPSGKMAFPASPVSSPTSADSASPGKNVFQQMLTDINGQQHQADAQVQRSLQGETDIHEAALALEKVDLSLRLLVQVRNKLITAYEELSRMSM
jgi:flagellar hook-basal body complex protein FliE